MELEPSLAGVDMVRSDAVNKLHPKYWLNVNPQDEEHYWQLLRDARIAMTKQGYYDPKMMSLLKRIRCKTKIESAECTQGGE